jgi:hypothetical protein
LKQPLKQTTPQEALQSNLNQPLKQSRLKHRLCPFINLSKPLNIIFLTTKQKGMTPPTHASLRSIHLKHITKWINKINDYKNEIMDLPKSYSLLSAECMLLNQFYKFTNYSPGVLGDLAVAHATQEEFDHEQAFQKTI